MKSSRSFLILVDAIINLVIGVVLLLFPLGVPGWLGLPGSAEPFYPLILGAVIFGIGLALILEFISDSKNWRGLGLEGAITINFCGGGMLLIWLIFSNMNIPFRGLFILWTIAIVVLAVGMIELLMTFSGKTNKQAS